jgi:hypothetical protein
MLHFIETISWQQGVVALLLLLCVGCIARWTYHFFRHTQAEENPCANCDSACALKDLHADKKHIRHTDKKKKCCG